MKHILIDSDVILDFYFDRQPFSEYASFVLSQFELKQAHGFVTPVIISNVYYLLRKQASHEIVINNLKQLLQLTDVLVIDKSVVLRALNSPFRDFEDALQNYAGEHSNKIDLIITRNVKDYNKSELAVMTPKQYFIMQTSNRPT